MQDARKDFREFYHRQVLPSRPSPKEILAAQALSNVNLANRLEEVDYSLGGCYSLCETAHSVNIHIPSESQIRPEIVRLAIETRFPKVLGELEKLLALGVIPTLEAGFAEVVRTGLHRHSLPQHYQGNPGLSGIYERARQLADKVAVR